jgi:hypothetical protein
MRTGRQSDFKYIIVQLSIGIDVIAFPELVLNAINSAFIVPLPLLER